ncbi:hypothetical protein HK100_011164 [Physocladia obscura]|uniref:Uncharacterized protein n=1 Tax=Physocladia obscura TaxID=109957 RepID=A0AAD5XK89_9FUNG|nr:hypothetical protein HK100_011164 [Physocladia obscura]
MAASGDTDRQLNESEPDAASNSLQLDSLEDLLESSKNSTSELIANDSFGSQFWSESTLTSEMNWIDNVFNTSMLAMPTGGINNNSSSGELNPSVECVGIDQGLCSFLWGPIKDFSSANNQFDGNLWNSLNYPFMDAAALTQIVADYFRDASDEVTILIQSTKITQKSYGSEKRNA